MVQFHSDLYCRKYKKIQPQLQFQNMVYPMEELRETKIGKLQLFRTDKGSKQKQNILLTLNYSGPETRDVIELE